MPPRFELTAITEAGRHCLTLTDAEHQQIVSAKRGIVASLGLEEKFQLLLDNYLDYEREVLDLAARSTVFESYAWGSLQDDLVGLNRRLANLLTAAKLLSDHSRSALISLYGREAGVTAVHSAAEQTERQTTLGYRVMEEIRNHLQHRQLPVHSASYQYDLEGDIKGGRLRRHSVHPQTSISRLADDRSLRKGILDELRPLGDDVALGPLVRGYVAGLARVHNSVRVAMAPDISVWESAFVASLERAKAAFPELLFVFATRIEQRGADETREDDALFEALMQRRRELVKRTARAPFLENGFVSNRDDVAR